MGWSYHSWTRNGGGSYGQWHGGYSKRRSWPSQHQKVLWCTSCGNWMYAHRAHTHCSCGAKWDREGAGENSWSKDKFGYYKEDWSTGTEDLGSLPIDTLVSALEKVTGKDIRSVLAEHLPQPAAVEKKLETESESFAEFRKARTKWDQADKAKEKASKALENLKAKIADATAKLEEKQNEVDQAAENLANIKKDNIQKYPAEYRQKESLLHGLGEPGEGEEQQEPAAKKAREGEGPGTPKSVSAPQPAPQAYASHSWHDEFDGDDGMGGAAGDGTFRG